MEKKITRTFKFFAVTIKDGQTGEVLKSYESNVPVKREKIAVAYIKETKKTNFIIDIAEREELREMSFDKFIEHSKIVGAEETPTLKAVAPLPLIKMETNYYGNTAHG